MIKIKVAKCIQNKSFIRNWWQEGGDALLRISLHNNIIS